jgi:hypothetical protein
MPHALEVFTMTFEDTPNRHKAIAPTNLQILSQVELMEALGAEHVEEVVS